MRRSGARWALVICTALAGCGGDSDGSDGERIPADPDAIAAAAAEAMGEVTSVRFTLTRSGTPVYIDEFETLALEQAEGRYSAPAAADAVLTVEVGGSLTTKLGAVGIDDTVWLSNPVTGDFELLPEGYDLDPSSFFDPDDGWRPLFEQLRDPVLVGEEDRDGERYHISGIAPAAQVEVITARLVRNQDVAVDIWIHPVTGLVTAAEFTTSTSDGDTSWVLELRDYGDSFEIEPPDVGD
jgi:lipoprotein LprG